jgi:hypothetical protein
MCFALHSLSTYDVSLTVCLVNIRNRRLVSFSWFSCLLRSYFAHVVLSFVLFHPCILRCSPHFFVSYMQRISATCLPFYLCELHKFLAYFVFVLGLYNPKRVFLFYFLSCAKIFAITSSSWNCAGIHMLICLTVIYQKDSIQIELWFLLICCDCSSREKSSNKTKCKLKP